MGASMGLRCTRCQPTCEIGIRLAFPCHPRWRVRAPPTDERRERNGHDEGDAVEEGLHPVVDPTKREAAYGSCEEEDREDRSWNVETPGVDARRAQEGRGQDGHRIKVADAGVARA